MVKALKDEWDRRLKEEGLEIKEVTDYSFINKAHDMEGTRDFYLTIDAILTFYTEMPKHEREIMSRYSSGVLMSKIAKELKINRITVRRVVDRYKGIVRLIERMRAMSHF